MCRKFETIFYGDVINCVRDKNGKEYNLQEMIVLLNEQQSEINSLKMELEFSGGVKLFSRRELERKVDEQQAEIEHLKNNVYDELDKALKILEEIYDDYPKNNVHRLYNNLKGLKEMVR